MKGESLVWLVLATFLPIQGTFSSTSTEESLIMNSPKDPEKNTYKTKFESV